MNSIPQIVNTVCMGNPVLTQIAKPFTKEEILSASTKNLIKNLSDVLSRYGPYGVGLAAPQIDQSRRLIYIQVPEELGKALSPMPMFNPEIEFQLKHESIWALESCISIPNYCGLVKRFNNVIVHYLNEFAEPKIFVANGFHAALIQHEVDHLDGILYLERLQNYHDLALMSTYEHLVDIPEKPITSTGMYKKYDDNKL